MRKLAVLVVTTAICSTTWGLASASPIATAESYLDGAASRTLVRTNQVDRAGRMRVLLHPARGAAPIEATLGKEALLQLAPEVDPVELVAEGVTVIRAIAPPLGIYLVRGRSGEDGLDLAVRLQRHPAARGAIPDLAFPMVRATRAFSPPPDDPRYPDQWFWERIDLAAAWSRETGSPSTTVVVIDDGCDLLHPDLVGQLDPGKDAFSMDDDPSYLPSSPSNEHGTACAGLVAASTNNGVGVAGACPGCRLRCVRLLGADGAPIPLSADMVAFQFAFDVGAAVVSNSWGFKDAVPVPDMIRQQLEQLHDAGRGGRGTVVVFAAGNDDRVLGDDEINAVRGVVTVGATNNFDELTSYSNHGACVDVVSPTGTTTTDISGPDGIAPGDYTNNFSGTSSACPIVAGVLGLMASAAPDRSAAELEEALFASARQSKFATPDATGHDDYYGVGAIRPLDALRLLSGEVLDGGVADAGSPPLEDSGCGCAIGRGDALSGNRTAAIALWAAFALGLRGLRDRRARRALPRAKG